MNNDKSWHKELNAFLAENKPSTDTRVLARALNSFDAENDSANTQDLVELERALHIEQHLDDIGLQPLSLELEKKLQNISKAEQNNKVIRGKFNTNWKKASAIAATITAIVIFGTTNQNKPIIQQPTLTEIKQAEQELTLALQYVSFAQAKSANKIQQTLDENIRRPLNQGLLKPLNHFKESS
jgi:hypothetical protein